MEKQAVRSSSEIEGNRTESDGAHAHASALKKGPWTAEEDAVLAAWVDRHGEGNWGRLQRLSGLARCGKSCRLRWTNHLRPHLKKGPLSQFEELLLISLHRRLGNKWSRIAAQLPGRTDNEIKNFWNTRAKRLRRMGLPLYPPPPLLTTPGSSSSTDDFANEAVHNCNVDIHKLKKLLYDACMNLTDPPHQDKEPSVSIQAGAISHEFVDGNKNADASYVELLYHKQNISRSLGISQAPYMFLLPPPHSCLSRPPLLPPHHYQNYCSNKDGPSCDITSFPSPSFEHKNNLLSTTGMCVLSPQVATDGALQFASTNCNGAPHHAAGILQKSIINPGVLEQLLNGTAAYQTNAAWDAELNLADTSLGEVLDPCTSLIPDMEASHVSSAMASQGGSHHSSLLVDQTGRIQGPMKPDETASRVESQELMMSRQAVEMQQASLLWNTMNVAGLEELLEHLPTNHVSSNH